MSKELKMIIPIFMGLFVGTYIIMFSVFGKFDERISILENANYSRED